ncbi:MAG: hypothetical protein DI563_13295 [Variovorax paradoxus]|uniref:Uncharacterized protein n=1 Tax=Variovorax paradoxus TaxID=34073 RepID=A0A2W5QBS3_VARPD|nr:MAG: hypothetical protein DI563_13295 [Variovorax paradoxus]
MTLSTSRGAGAVRGMVAAALIAVAPWAAAQQDPSQFPAAAVRFLDGELPAMDAAVRSGDRTYFHDAMARMVDFADAWGFKSRANPELARFPMCTGAVQDFLVVGLCRVTPNGEDCTPMLANGFERNLRACRDAAR